MKFRPALVPTLAMIVLVTVFCSAGTWQWNRMNYKQGLQDAREKNRNLPEAELSAGNDAGRDMVGRKVTVSGILGGRLIYLDNQKYRGEPGFHVFAVMKIGSSREGVLVNLGWVREKGGKNVLPAVSVNSSVRQLAGIVSTWPAIGLKLHNPAMENDRWPKLLQYIDREWLQKRTGLNLKPYVLMVNENTINGLVADWRGIAFGKMKIPPEKHLSYSVQWFALATAVIIVWIVVNLRRGRKENINGDEDG